MTYGTATPDLATVIEALSDPSRRSLIEALRAGPQPVVRLAEGVPISRPAVSQHLRVLSDAGLVTVRQEGTRRYYGLHPEGFTALRDYLDTLWDDALAAFQKAARARAAEEASKMARKDNQ